ncbi:hypothetical protein [Brevibacillus parabrevis]|uniref:hypothetical protein n=1 Tax=Brevibacillus parabrevis TaxID=54914 RepID=UPI002E20D308|nr:hypothetical protein [Brevibacillus parabrevis]
MRDHFFHKKLPTIQNNPVIVSRLPDWISLKPSVRAKSHKSGLKVAIDVIATRTVAKIIQKCFFNLLLSSHSSASCNDLTLPPI